MKSKFFMATFATVIFFFSSCTKRIDGAYGQIPTDPDDVTLFDKYSEKRDGVGYLFTMPVLLNHRKGNVWANNNGAPYVKEGYTEFNMGYDAGGGNVDITEIGSDGRPQPRTVYALWESGTFEEGPWLNLFEPYTKTQLLKSSVRFPLSMVVSKYIDPNGKPRYTMRKR